MRSEELAKSANRATKLLRAGKLSDKARFRLGNHEGWREALELYPEYTANPLKPYFGMKAADRMNAVKMLTSGRHTARPGEVVIPSGFTGEFVGSKPFKNFVFRGGNPSTPSAHFFSRHPDVGANYAMNRRADGLLTRRGTGLFGRLNARNLWRETIPNPILPTAPKSKLMAFRSMPGQLRDQATGGLKGPALPALGHTPDKVPAMRLPGNSKHLLNDGATSPTYESVLLHGKMPRVGSYHARHVRGEDGFPALALSDDSGLPLKKLMQDTPAPDAWLEKLKNLTRKKIRTPADVTKQAGARQTLESYKVAPGIVKEAVGNRAFKKLRAM